MHNFDKHLSPVASCEPRCKTQQHSKMYSQILRKHAIIYPVLQPCKNVWWWWWWGGGGGGGTYVVVLFLFFFFFVLLSILVCEYVLSSLSRNSEHETRFQHICVHLAHAQERTHQKIEMMLEIRRKAPWKVNGQLVICYHNYGI